MRILSRITLIAPALLLAGCTLLPAFRESAYVEQAIRTVPGVTFVNVYGWKHPLRAEGGLTVDTIVDNRIVLTFANVGEASVGIASTELVLLEAGDARPLALSCLHGAPWSGDQSKNPRRRMVAADFHRNGRFGAHLAPGIVDIVDAVARSEALRAALLRWPICPSYWEFADAAGVPVRYCANVGETHALPPWPPGCE
jgi:hypothetical protein